MIKRWWWSFSFWKKNNIHLFIKRKKKINDSKGSSYVKIDKLVDLFELLSEWTSITIEIDDYDDRGKPYLVNELGIWLMKSLLAIIQSRLHSQTYTYCVYPYACVYKMTRDNLIVPPTRSRMKFQGESEFFCLNNRSVYWLYW